MPMLTKSRPAKYLVFTVIAFVIIYLIIVFRHQDIARQTHEILKHYGPYGQNSEGSIQDSRQVSELNSSVDIIQRMFNTTPSTDKPLPAFNDSDHVGRESHGIENKTEGFVQLKLCPFDPANLIGNLTPNTQDIEPSYLEESFPDLEDGGRLRPRDCVPRQRLALIIPYRNRWLHLHVMLHNLLPILKRQQADVTTFVIEQALPGRFNRGALFNIGFLEAEKLGDFDCYIFHDVDLIPLNDYHLYRCDSQPRHFAVYMNKYNYQLAYPDYFGGVVGFSRGQYLKINGNSNLYFGWGAEDDDLYQRTLSQGLTVSRSSTFIARYFMFSHSRDKGNEDNPMRIKILNTATKRMYGDGLNTCKYKVNEITLNKLYTWINVSLNETDILKTASSYMLHLMSVKQKPEIKLQHTITNLTDVVNVNKTDVVKSTR